MGRTLSPELRRQARAIEFQALKLVQDMMVGGRYRSRFRGQGVQFSEHRQYVHGDDVRHINWTLSARTRDPMVKQFEEERELTIFLVLDISKSTLFGTRNSTILDVIIQLAALLAYAAVHSGDKIGLVMVPGGNKIIMPTKGQKAVHQIICALLSAEQSVGDTGQKLASLERVMRGQRGIVCVLSDFLDTQALQKPLGRLSRAHDCMLVRLMDPRMRNVPPLGWMRFVDPETGVLSWVDTGSSAFQKWHTKFITDWDKDFLKLGQKARTVDIDIGSDPVKAFIKFLQKKVYTRA